MNNKLEIITNSIVESYPRLEKEILCFGLVITDFHLKYYVLSEKCNEDINANILEIVQDILTELGVENKPNNQVDFKYDIEYEIFDTLLEFESAINDKNFICLYIKFNTALLCK